MVPPQMLQYEPEFQAFLDILQDVGARSYLEIGCKHGGTLWRVGMVLPKGSVCVGVDLLRNPGSASYSSMHSVIRGLESEGRQCTLVWGNSTTRPVIDKTRALGPFDAVFIDADHSYDGVRLDWANYGPMATKLVAFHDICYIKSDVPRFWGEIRASHHYSELRYAPGGVNNGIGVIYV